MTTNSKIPLLAFAGTIFFALTISASAETPQMAMSREDPDLQLRVKEIEGSVAGSLLELGLDADAFSSFTSMTALKQRLMDGRAGRRAVTAKGTKPKIVIVDCTKGQSIQAAIDQNNGPLTVEVRGICQENVRIERKRVTLRGLDPSTDGIQGIAGDPSVIAALEIHYVDGALIENLSLSNGSTLGVGFWFSHADMENCRIENNASTGVHVSSASFLFALETVISGNGGIGLNAQRSAVVFCDACDIENNASWAGRSVRGALLTMRDSVIDGQRGMLALGDGGLSYIDHDCVSAGTGHPCSLTANLAAWAAGPSTAAVFGSGDFDGNLLALDRAHLLVFGARQLSTGVTGSGNPRPNFITNFATLDVSPYFDGVTTHQSQLRGDTIVETFSRALLFSETVVDGNLHCSNAGDAWASAGVVVTPGGGIHDCAHAPPPAP